ncbi:MAG: hypothetical protein H6766_03050 [Candidatus Peribacteria bacterium]|nr:MAG: hypothetical protein H6766_03050 [Candidatus Peribacteria bacterium]
MKKTNLVALIATGVGAVAVLTSLGSAAKTTDVYLTISGGQVSIGVTGNLDLGTFTVSDVDQTVEGQYAAATNEEYFWVKDLKGADTGWYTTVQVSDMIGANGTIPAANISLKVDPATVTKLSGKVNSLIEIASTWSTYQVASSPLTFIERSTGGAQAAGPNGGKLSMYGVLPWVQVVIPAYQEVGSYTSTITYTLIEN